MQSERHRTHTLPAERVTPAGEDFFFGYYDKFATNASDHLLLALRAPFIDHLPGPDDPVTVGRFDLDQGRREFVPLGQSHAWCWQQSNMIQWLPEDPERLFICNDFREGAFVSVVRDVGRGGTEERVLPRAVYTLSQTGPAALCANFARIYAARAGYGYPNLPDPNADVPVPDDDGVWLMDTTTGENSLVLSIAQMAALEPSVTNVPGSHHWVNHIQINPAGTRFACLHRFRAPSAGRSWITRLITAGLDGSDPRLLVPAPMVSHYDWRDDETILGWASPGPLMHAFYLIEDRPRVAECPVPFCRPLAPDVLTADGHCSYSPDRRFILNDSYPDRERKRTLMLFRTGDEVRFDIGRFYAPRELDGEHRCDLHPNWFRNGLRVCIDSVHEGFRGIYALDVSEIAAQAGG